MSALAAGTSLLKILQVFTEELETGGTPRSTITMFAVLSKLFLTVAVIVTMSSGARRVRLYATSIEMGS